MTTAFFLRHGVTLENSAGRIQGHQPGTINMHRSEHYIAALAPLLRQENPQVLISSDLERAVKTRKILRQFLQPPKIDEEQWPLLREISLGSLEGQLLADLPPDIQQQLAQNNFDFTEFGGERASVVQQRVQQTLLKLAREHPEQKAALITHEGWLIQLTILSGHYTETTREHLKKRQSIYKAAISPDGQLTSLQAISIQAKPPDE
jgi:broad specificity phosphatase PhoE